MSRTGNNKANSLKQPKEEINIKYMHRPPTISPNYGSQKRSLLPKSKVSRVLLYDNATQDHMLDIKLSHINIEKERICRLINLHKRTFTVRQVKKQQHMAAITAGHKKDIENASSVHRRNNQHTENTLSMDKLPEIRPTSANEANETKPEVENVQETQEGVSVDINNNEQDKSNERKSANERGFKLPEIEDDQRHLIFKLKDSEGNTKIYHTVDENRIIGDLIPIHTFYPKLTDDPRFKLLHSSLVPTYNGRGRLR